MPSSDRLIKSGPAANALGAGLPRDIARSSKQPRHTLPKRDQMSAARRDRFTLAQGAGGISIKRANAPAEAISGVSV